MTLELLGITAVFAGALVALAMVIGQQTTPKAVRVYARTSRQHR
ncbi:hypothetical protein [Polycladidibacter hongkongensis]|nr:hypothetical protein [Pseudovibrio hongkongensis]